MFREMRRKKQQLPPEETERILREATAGVLALAGENGYPYAVPLSFVYAGDTLYFHCAKAGQKLEALRREPRASFCVVGSDAVKPEEYTTYFRSVIVFGRIRELPESEEKRRAILALAEKYYPGDTETHRLAAVEKEAQSLNILALQIEHMTGKEAIELTRQRKEGGCS